jgi:hypothetical protein
MQRKRAKDPAAKHAEAQRRYARTPAGRKVSRDAQARYREKFRETVDIDLSKEPQQC